MVTFARRFLVLFFVVSASAHATINLISINPTQGAPAGTGVVINGCCFTQGSSYTVSYNGGAATSTALYLNASQLTTSLPSSLPVGTATVSLKSPTGEGSNTISYPITAAVPDLVVTDIVWDPSVPYYVKVKYKNIGTIGSANDFLIRITNTATGQHFDGNPYYRFKVPLPGVEAVTGGFTLGLIGLAQGQIATIKADIDWERRVVGNPTYNDSLTKTVSLGAPAPVVQSFTPASGPVGTSVTIAGAHFTAASAVKFNGVSAAFQLTSDSQIVATVPSGATTGTISVTSPAGTGTSAASFSVTVPMPTVTGFTPASGGAGTMVMISGTNFTPSASTARPRSRSTSSRRRRSRLS